MKTFSIISGIIFALVALSHLWRITQGITISAEGTIIPMWVSWVAFVAAGVLAYFGFWFGMNSDTPDTHKPV